MNVVFAGGPTYAKPTGTFYAPGKWLWETPRLSAPLAQILFGSAPGVQGMYSIDLGLKEQEFLLRVLYVGADDSALLAEWNTDATAIVGPNDATLGSVALKRCFLDSKATICTEIEKIVAGDGQSTLLYMMYANIKASAKGAAA